MDAPPTPTLPRQSTPIRSASGTSIAVGRGIYERSLQRSRPPVSLSGFAYMYGEAVSYAHKQAKGVSDLEQRLNKLGYHVGLRLSELLALRTGKTAKRETEILKVLQLVHTTVWRTLFGAPMDSIERSNDNQNEYMLHDNNPLVSEYISVPRDLSQLNCAAFAGGVIEAVLESCGFGARVTAHSMGTEQEPYKTVFLVRLESA